VPADTLEDAEEVLREAAAPLLLRYGDAEDLARLAALLEGERSLGPAELHSAAFAVRRLGRVGPRGRAVLARAVEERPTFLAAEAAAALLAAAPEAGAHALRTRVGRHLTDAEAAGHAGTEAALFELRAGPLPEDLRARLRAAANPLLAACAAADPLAALRPILAVRLGGRELYRLEIVARLLDRAHAGEADRVAFAASALGSEATAARRAGLGALRDVPAEAWAALRPVVVGALDDRDEPVRIAAAALLAPAPGALRVCADALYDGDPWSAQRVAAILKRAGLPEVDPRAPVATRRRQSLALGERPREE
jgi:hypothetical protein